jgi:hypothetical protein
MMRLRPVRFQPGQAHLVQIKAFALLLIVALGTLAISIRTTALDVLLINFAAWAGLHATRNIPLAAMLLTLTVSPLLGAALHNLPVRKGLAASLRRQGSRVSAFAARMGARWKGASRDSASPHLL